MNTKTDATASSPTIEAASALFDRHPKDVVNYIKTGGETFDCLSSTFTTIKLLYEKSEGNQSSEIRRLIDIGKHVSDDFSDYLDCEAKRLERCIEAAMEDEAIPPDSAPPTETKPKKGGITPWNYASYLALSAIYDMASDEDKTIEMNSRGLRELFGLLGDAMFEDLNIALGNV
jgi:hypothetical protein